MKFKGLPRKHVIMVPAKPSDSFQGTVKANSAHSWTPAFYSDQLQDYPQGHRALSISLSWVFAVPGAMMHYEDWVWTRLSQRVFTQMTYVGSSTVARHLWRHWELLESREKWDLKPPRMVGGLPRGDDTRTTVNKEVFDQKKRREGISDCKNGLNLKHGYHCVYLSFPGSKYSVWVIPTLILLIRK